jgi:hypothetical protein
MNVSMGRGLAIVLALLLGVSLMLMQACWRNGAVLH